MIEHLQAKGAGAVRDRLLGRPVAAFSPEMQEVHKALREFLMDRQQTVGGFADWYLDELMAEF